MFLFFFCCGNTSQSWWRLRCCIDVQTCKPRGCKKEAGLSQVNLWAVRLNRHSLNPHLWLSGLGSLKVSWLLELMFKVRGCPWNNRPVRPLHTSWASHPVCFLSLTFVLLFVLPQFVQVLHDSSFKCSWEFGLSFSLVAQICFQVSHQTEHRSCFPAERDTKIWIWFKTVSKSSICYFTKV